MHILDKIVAHKRKEVERLKSETSFADFEKSEHFGRHTNSLLTRLKSDTASGVIAEFKKKSPSKQNINLDARVEDIVPQYQAAGASAISILTDESFFGGGNTILTKARNLVPDMPLLRKDFIIDEIQIIEAKSIGADIILLIAEILTAEQVALYARLAREHQLEVLLELHSEDQLHKVAGDVSYVGVNNRNLKTFEVDYEQSKRICHLLPTDMPKITESGLSDASIVADLYSAGFNGCLVGEHFMRSDQPGEACKEFVQAVLQTKSCKQS